MAPMIRGGRVVDSSEENAIQKLIAWFWALLNAVFFFGQTLINPEASSNYSAHGRKKGWGTDKKDGRGPGGGGGSGGGPRISGMGNLGGGGNPPCGPGGGCCGCG